MSTSTGYIVFINQPDEVRRNWSLKLKGSDTLYISRKPLDMYNEGDEIAIEYTTNKRGFNWIDSLSKITKKTKTSDSLKDILDEHLGSTNKPDGDKKATESDDDLPTRVGIKSDTAARLSAIRKRTGTPTNEEVVRNAVRLVDTIIKEFDKGNELLPSYMLGAMGIDERHR